MAATATHMVLARIWEKIQPIDRGDRYEDPLNDLLSERKFGQVTGGGTQLGEQGEIEFADIELDLRDPNESVDFIISQLESMGAPAGSEILFDVDSGREPIRFGKSEGVGLYLDGVSLPDHVYAEADVNDLIDQFNHALGEGSIGEMRNVWEGPEETALYFYGDNADEIFSAIEPILQREPLCQNSRVVLRIGHPDLDRKEMRMPMQ